MKELKVKPYNRSTYTEDALNYIEKVIRERELINKKNREKYRLKKVRSNKRSNKKRLRK